MAKITDQSMTATITNDEYYNLRVTAEKMSRLENGGVDNWQSYGDSLNPDDEIDWDEREEEIRKEIMHD